MAVKLLISAESNSGKTSLTKPLKDTLVISHDGKIYPFPIPHVNINSFANVDELIDIVGEKVEAYHEKFGKYPANIVFDSVSKIFDTIMDNCNIKFTGFKIYTELNKEISEFTRFIEHTIIPSDINVILISHAIYDTETGRYNLIGKGDFAKRGGFIAEVDEAIFIELKSNKRLIHYRSTKFPARTLQDDLDASVNVEDFDLNQHINLIAERQDTTDEYAL